MTLKLRIEFPDTTYKAQAVASSLHRLIGHLESIAPAIDRQPQTVEGHVLDSDDHIVGEWEISPAKVWCAFKRKVKPFRGLQNAV